MNAGTGKVLVMIGSVLLAVGVLLPVVWIPVGGTTKLLDLGWAGIVILALAAVALLLAFVDRTRHALWPALASLFGLAYAYIQVQKKIAEAQRGLNEFDLSRPLDILRGVVASNARLEYGWAVLGLGAFLILAGAAMSWRREPALPEP